METWWLSIIINFTQINSKGLNNRYIQLKWALGSAKNAFDLTSIVYVIVTRTYRRYIFKDIITAKIQNSSWSMLSCYTCWCQTNSLVCIVFVDKQCQKLTHLIYLGIRLYLKTRFPISYEIKTILCWKTQVKFFFQVHDLFFMTVSAILRINRLYYYTHISRIY